jgi:hypothetical protein
VLRSIGGRLIGSTWAYRRPQISSISLTLYCFGRHGSFVLPWNMASLSFLFLSPLKESWQPRLLHRQTAPSRRSNPASSVAGGSQFHWPPEVSEILQPILAHGPRFGPRLSSIATGPRRRGWATAKGFYPTAKGFSAGRETAGCFICMQLTPQPSLTSNESNSGVSS